jgi:hypothetical protein
MSLIDNPLMCPRSHLTIEPTLSCDPSCQWILSTNNPNLTSIIGPKFFVLFLKYCFDFFVMALTMMVFKARIMRDYKESKVKIYKSIWDLVFKCNGSGR